MTATADRRGDRMHVVVIGELDIETDHSLHRTLNTALRQSRTGIDLDLGQVGFCDCSGLNTLLRIRQLALKQGKTVTVSTTSTAMTRLLGLTHTLPLFTSPEDSIDQELRTEVVQLRRAMQTRPVIDMARGLLIASFNLTPEDAWSVLVEVSQRTNTKLHHLAQNLLGTVNGEQLPDPARQEINEAVARLTAARSADI
ncbi:ANTAR domain-containing protein [Streptomyces sp. NPDC050738]|uniref:ANTAR domain-containing protein n=1 Tax=Streptomyces sp. NPDC050738 TaxID=3154744 RepID=UPI003426EA7F